MTAEPLRRGSLLGCIVSVVVRRVAVGKTVRHDEVDHVLRTITRVRSRLGTALANHIIDVRRLLVLRQRDAVRAGLVDVEVHEQVVR